MKRDLDLIRQILIRIEECPDPQGPGEIQIEGYSSEQISYHIKLLAGAGLIEAHDLSASGDIYWLAGGLTWQGHEFLDAARNDTVWNRTKDIIKEKGGSIPFTLVQEIVVMVAKTVFGLG